MKNYRLDKSEIITLWEIKSQLYFNFLFWGGNVCFTICNLLAINDIQCNNKNYFIITILNQYNTTTATIS